MAKSNGNPSALRDDILAIKRERILNEAVTLFYEQGYLPTNVDAIAQKLGATKPFVYYHFNSKVALLSEICSRMMQEAYDATEAAARMDGTPTEKLTEFVLRFTEMVLERHKYVSIYFREQLNLPADVNTSVTELRKKIDYRLRDILKDGRAAGEFEFANLAVASQIVSGMISYTFAWYHEGSALPKEAICQQMAEHVLRSVSVDPARVEGLVKRESA